MCSATRWLVTAAGLILCVFLPNSTIAEDSRWLKAMREGKQLREQGNYAEAEKAHLLALGEAEKFGPEGRLALSLNELATLYHATGRLREAEPLYQRALATWEKVSEPLELAATLSNLARLCLDQERYNQAEQLSNRALAISRDLAPSHPEVASSLDNLADVHALQGRYAQAEPLYRQALTILEET